MPFKSEAQRRKFQELVKQGKITQEEYDKWDAGTPKKLPQRAAGRSLKTGVRRPKYVKGPR